jgi:hypothetical protein
MGITLYISYGKGALLEALFSYLRNRFSAVFSSAILYAVDKVVQLTKQGITHLVIPTLYKLWGII